MTASFKALQVSAANTWFSAYARRLVILLLCSSLMLSGCAGDLPLLKGKKADEETASAPGSKQSAEEAEPLVYYVGVESLRLYEEPRTSANVLADLEQYQKVYRYKIEKGYAWVKVDGSEMTGWVNNAKLIWRLPKPGADEPVAQPSEAASPPPDDVLEAGAPEDGTESTTPAKPGSETVDPSRFDAF